MSSIKLSSASLAFDTLVFLLLETANSAWTVLDPSHSEITLKLDLYVYYFGKALPEEIDMNRVD